MKVSVITKMELEEVPVFVAENLSRMLSLFGDKHKEMLSKCVHNLFEQQNIQEVFVTLKQLREKLFEIDERIAECTGLLVDYQIQNASKYLEQQPTIPQNITPEELKADDYSEVNKE